MIRNLILDWSGTLFDDLTPVLRTTNHVFEQFGLATFSRDEFRRHFCLPVRKFYERLLPQVALADLEQAFFAKFAEHRDGIYILPHTAAFLEFCAEQRLACFVASTVDPHTYHGQMQRFGMDRYITRAYLGIADKTEQIHRILEENRLDPRETLFVGDMEHDIEAGRAGGVRTCAVLTGYNHDETLRALQPDLVCEHLGELQHHLAAQFVGHG